MTHGYRTHARHCRVCGSRRLRMSVRRRSGGAAVRCRDCGTKIRPSEARLWQKRRPIASWLFSGGF